MGLISGRQFSVPDWRLPPIYVLSASRPRFVCRRLTCSLFLHPTSFITIPKSLPQPLAVRLPSVSPRLLIYMRNACRQLSYKTNNNRFRPPRRPGQPCRLTTNPRRTTNGIARATVVSAPIVYLCSRPIL